MREKKFRAWEKDKKEMFYFGLNCLDISIMTDKWGESPQDKGFEIMQFTGLKDKNGKEIYESDYVFIEDFYIGDKIQIGGKCEVKWNEDGFSLFIEDEYICGLWDAVNNYSGEVIGNIYENPELLKAGE